MRKSYSEELDLVWEPTPAEIESVSVGLTEHNQAATGGRFDFPGDSDPGLVIQLAVKDPKGGVVGGVSTSSVLGVMWLEVLWVADEFRRSGLAS